ncbi:hypothetical protein GCM10007423_39970 [Dyadobacter endophyticus]|uniref:DUF4868 domain-containing protein n=1 Tax=Dyadobacter endophyticus TaxID=1749036 RepID=A0ABQ1YY04_9BACT|nr:hypothetical protein [Dyadobacter endophyticus]GGH42953.1 hypothetical protein GCM10007423_39970 [Dyadobacter endophyticus]
MNPLESLVGLSPVDTGSERMFVNRLPNVSAELIKAIAESDEKSVDDPTGLETVWQEVKEEAYDQLKSCLLSEFAKRANFREVVQQSETPDMISDPEELNFTVDTMVGVTVTMPKSRYQQLYVRALYVQFASDAPTDLTIRLYDGDRGTQIGADITAPVTADSFEFPVNVTVDCAKAGNRSIFIGVLVPDGATLKSMGWAADCMYSINDLHSFDPDEPSLLADMQEMDDCFVALDYEIRLSMDKVTELFKDKLRRCYGLLCGAGIIDRALKSKKANRYTLVNREAEFQNLADLKEDLKKETAGACRQIYGQLEMEKLALVSRPDDQQGYFVGDYV